MLFKSSIIISSLLALAASAGKIDFSKLSTLVADGVQLTVYDASLDGERYITFDKNKPLGFFSKTKFEYFDKNGTKFGGIVVGDGMNNLQRVVLASGRPTDKNFKYVKNQLNYTAKSPYQFVKCTRTVDSIYTGQILELVNGPNIDKKCKPVHSIKLAKIGK